MCSHEGEKYVIFHSRKIKEEVKSLSFCTWHNLLKHQEQSGQLFAHFENWPAIFSLQVISKTSSSPRHLKPVER